MAALQHSFMLMFRINVDISKLRLIVLESILFLIALVIIYCFIWTRLRMTGVGILIALNCLVGIVHRENRSRVWVRLLVLAVTALTVVLFRSIDSHPLQHRYVRMALIAGGLTHVLFAIPAWLIDLASRMSLLQAAVCGVFLPVLVMQSLTVSNIGAGDTMPVVPTVVCQLTSGSRDLTPFVESMPGRWGNVYGPSVPYFVREVHDRNGYFSAYPAGMEFFAWPGVGLAFLSGFNLFDDDVHLWIEKLTAAVISALSLSMFFSLASTFASRRTALVCTWLLATGSVFTTTLGMLLWQQSGVVFWSLLVLLLERFRQGTLLQGLACGMMFACRPSSVTFLVPFGIWLFMTNRKRGIVVFLSAVLVYVPWAFLYTSVYSSAIGPSQRQVQAEWVFLGFLPDLLFSPARGLLVYQPIFWLVLFAGLSSCRKKIQAAFPAGWIPFLFATSVCHLLLVSCWPIWWGGACYGSRLIAEVVPMLMLLLVPIVEKLLQQPVGQFLLITLALLGLAIHAPCAWYEAWVWNIVPVSVDRHPERLWDWSDPPFFRG